MTEEDKAIGLGLGAQVLLHDEAFVTAVETLKNQIQADMFATEPHESKKRDQIYARYVALSDIVTELASMVLILQGIEARRTLNDIEQEVEKNGD